jgi:trehalose 2-sulfotransferase
MPHEGKLRAQFDTFHAGSPGAARYERPKLPVRKTYCILITPRSGSTWLSRRISRLDVLSCPEEYFIADEFTNTLTYNPGRDIYEVFDIVAQKNCTNDRLFGFEMSYFDLEEFEREARLVDVMLGERYFFYLNRRNFVAQAISLHTAVESRVFHAIGGAGALQSRPAVPYDDNKIMYWVCHILQQEFGIRQWLRANKVKPVRLCYEELLENIDGAVARIARHLGVDLAGTRALPTPQTEKLAAARADDFERRFRHRHWKFCREWEAARGTAPCPYSDAPLAAAG